MNAAARVLVAAGSNIEPETNLVRAACEIAREFEGVRFSRAYRNPAVGFDGPDFINLVAVFAATLAPRATVERLRHFEALCGRPRHAPKWAPRSMDLDLLLYGDLVCESDDLTLPRPDLLKRAYMLGPAAEVAPDFRHPTSGATLSELWAHSEHRAHALTPVPLVLPA